MNELKEQFDEAIANAVSAASGIAWDGCHKIYVLLDDNELRQMYRYGYDAVYSRKEKTPAEMMRTLWKWFEDSCGLRFVNAVKAGEFTDLIPQFWGWEDEDGDEGEDKQEEKS